MCGTRGAEWDADCSPSPFTTSSFLTIKLHSTLEIPSLSLLLLKARSFQCQEERLCTYMYPPT